MSTPMCPYHILKEDVLNKSAESPAERRSAPYIGHRVQACRFGVLVFRNYSAPLVGNKLRVVIQIA